MHEEFEIPKPPSPVVEGVIVAPSASTPSCNPELSREGAVVGFFGSGNLPLNFRGIHFEHASTVAVQPEDVRLISAELPDAAVVTGICGGTRNGVSKLIAHLVDSGWIDNGK